MGVHAEPQGAVTCRLGHPDLEGQPDLELLLSSLDRSLPEKLTSPFLWVCSSMLVSDGRLPRVLPLYSKLLGKDVSPGGAKSRSGPRGVGYTPFPLSLCAAGGQDPFPV